MLPECNAPHADARPLGENIESNRPEVPNYSSLVLEPRGGRFSRPRVVFAALLTACIVVAVAFSVDSQREEGARKSSSRGPVGMLGAHETRNVLLQSSFASNAQAGDFRSNRGQRMSAQQILKKLQTVRKSDEAILEAMDEVDESHDVDETAVFGNASRPSNASSAEQGDQLKGSSAGNARKPETATHENRTADKAALTPNATMSAQAHGPAELGPRPAAGANSTKKDNSSTLTEAAESGNEVSGNETSSTKENAALDFNEPPVKSRTTDSLKCYPDNDDGGITEVRKSTVFCWYHATWCELYCRGQVVAPDPVLDAQPKLYNAPGTVSGGSWSLWTSHLKALLPSADQQFSSTEQLSNMDTRR